MNDNNKILVLRIVVHYLRQRRIAYTELVSEITKLRSTYIDINDSNLYIDID